MVVEEKFVELTGLICEPTRAKMLWNLLDGRAYTASELAVVANVSPTAASNHLAKLREADLVKVETQGRHRYFSFSKPEVAYAVESLASLANDKDDGIKKIETHQGIKYCRTCYDHLAGLVGVRITEALEDKKIISKSDGHYIITKKGSSWLTDFGVTNDALTNKRRPLTRQCLDWSERRPHLAGQLGAVLLEKMLEKKWFRKMKFSRELIVTSKGNQEIYESLKVEV
ncbi:MAG: winged helix-turn-helix transcriptional regulator [Bacteroidetes bacterium]|nr:MAG: winged helix-turn-helix transcriptional regulator [Bacteroidota bacterium]